jgi:prevent-host-death family protein
MSDHYSLYEAKAKLSALVRQVREGQSVVITVHGEPVAELRPYVATPRKQTLAERLAEMEARGEISPPRCSNTEYGDFLRTFQPTPVPGALERFLSDRGE